MLDNKGITEEEFSPERYTTLSKESDVHKARSLGVPMETREKFCGSKNKNWLNILNATKLEHETEELRHILIPFRVGLLIMQQRQKLAMSQQNLANKIGRNHRLIAQIEAGDDVIYNAGLIKRLESALGIVLIGKNSGQALENPFPKKNFGNKIRLVSLGQGCAPKQPTKANDHPKANAGGGDREKDFKKVKREDELPVVGNRKEKRGSKDRDEEAAPKDKRGSKDRDEKKSPKHEKKGKRDNVLEDGSEDSASKTEKKEKQANGASKSDWKVKRGKDLKNNFEDSEPKTEKKEKRANGKKDRVEKGKYKRAIKPRYADVKRAEAEASNTKALADGNNELGDNNNQSKNKKKPKKNAILPKTYVLNKRYK